VHRALQTMTLQVDASYGFAPFCSFLMTRTGKHPPMTGWIRAKGSERRQQGLMLIFSSRAREDSGNSGHWGSELCLPCSSPGGTTACVKPAARSADL
jgi:hypothetical protein